MADIQFDIDLDLVEKYVPAENVTVVQEDFQSVKFRFTILNREQPVDLTGATDIVVSFVKPDGHIVLQNDGSLVCGKVELTANPQTFTYVGKTYFQVQYKIGAQVFNTRQAFLFVERGNTSCQTLSSTDFAPMLDQAIQAGNMLAGIDLQALIDSKVTAENAQADVDALGLRVGALEVTIVGLDSRVDTLEASQTSQDTAISGLQNSQATQDTKIGTLETGQSGLTTRVSSIESNITSVISEVDTLQLTAVDHETRIDGLEANMPNLSPIEADITALKTKDAEQDGRIGANELAISSIQTKNTQQDTAITGNATGIANLQAKDVTHETRMTAIETKNTEQDTRLSAIEGVNTSQGSAISVLQSSQSTQDGKIATLETGHASQGTAIAANSTEIADLQAKDTTHETRMTAIENKNVEQDSRLSAVEGVNATQGAAITALQGSQATQDTKIAAVEDKNATQDTAIAANATSIATVDGKVTANKTAQDAINTSTAGSIANHATRIEDLETDSTTDNARITNLEMDNSSNKTRIATVEGAIGVLNSDINDLQSNDGVQNTRLTAIETKNTTQDGLIANNTSTIAANKADADGKITGLTTRVSTNETDITALKAKDVVHETRMSTIENKDNSQDTRMTAIEGVNTTQNTRLGTLETDNTSNKTRLTTLETDNTSNKSRLTAVESKNTSQDTDIASKVNKSEAYYTGLRPNGYNIDVNGQDCNNLIENGAYFGNNLLNAPEGSNGYFSIETRRVANSTSFVQYATRWGGTQMFHRSKVNTAEWLPWRELADRERSIQKIGDTMTGDLKFDKVPTGARYAEWSVDGVSNFKQGINSSNNFVWFDTKNNSIPMEYKLDTRTLQVSSSTLGGFQVLCDTNLMKKTDYTAKDGRADLTLTGSAVNVDSANVGPMVDRRGNTVTLRLAIRRTSTTQGDTLTTLPVDMRPTFTVHQGIISTDGAPARLQIATGGELTIQESGTNVQNKNFYITISYVVN